MTPIFTQEERTKLVTQLDICQESLRLAVMEKELLTGNFPNNKSEQINFFLVNILMLLDVERALILANNLLERLPVVTKAKLIEALYNLNNKPLYLDSGLWQIRSENMNDVLEQQDVNESFDEFIIRISV